MPRAVRRCWLPVPRAPVFPALVIVAALGGMLGGSAASGQDLIEFLSGARVEGKVTSIDKENRQVSFEALLGGRPFARVYPYSQIHAVTYRGARYVINEKGEQPTTPRPRPGGTGSSASDSASSGTGRAGGRSKGEVEALIREAGAVPPDWYDSTPLDFPKSLDLSWPEKPPGGWNNQVNVGQYIWDVINPNESRWRSGVRLLHYLLTLHKDDPAARTRVMTALGDMYFRFFQDYARAAFWWQQAGLRPGHPQGVAMAECYYRLGNKSLAEAWLVDPDRPSGTIHFGMIKVWGDMGETAKAVKLAQLYMSKGGPAHPALLSAGDALRKAGRYEEAMKFYRQCINTPPAGNKAAQKVIDRAQANLQAVQLFELTNVMNVADGVYSGSSQGYEGPVQVEVRVSGGRIEAVRVTRHTEKQFYSALADVPAQILEKQGVRGVDATSKATITAEAILNGTAKALAEGAKR